MENGPIFDNGMCKYAVTGLIAVLYPRLSHSSFHNPGEQIDPLPKV